MTHRLRWAIAAATLGLAATLAWAGTPRWGFNGTGDSAQDDNWNKLDQRLPLGVSGFPVGSYVACGNLANNGTVFLAPQGGGAGTATGDGAAVDPGGTVCA